MPATISHASAVKDAQAAREEQARRRACMMPLSVGRNDWLAVNLLVDLFDKCRITGIPRPKKTRYLGPSQSQIDADYSLDAPNLMPGGSCVRWEIPELDDELVMQSFVHREGEP